MLPGVRNIIPVGSGKGGVGKSTVSANLAVALAQTGARVGLMDADVYGPSIPTIMGITGRATAGAWWNITPLRAMVVSVISAGFFVRPDQAVVWRGPMLAKMIEQFLGQVQWGELDYLIVDLPPRHRRRAAHSLPADPPYRGRDRHDATAGGRQYRRKSDYHVQPAQVPPVGHHRKHELLGIAQDRGTRIHLRQRGRRKDQREVESAAARQSTSGNQCP